MNVSKVSYSLIGLAMTVGVVSSCVEPKYEEKAKTQAIKYLKGDELLKAERFSMQQHNFDKQSGEAVAYWDSLVIDAKVKEAYLKGMQVIKDSANGKFFRKEKYKAPLDTICSDDLINDVKKEFAKYSTAEEFVYARDNAPKDYVTGVYNNLAASTHYWNLIVMAGKQNEAYKQGMADSRKELINE